jgi:hypothetical protein
MSPNPSTADPSVTTATMFFLVVSVQAFSRIVGDRLRDAGDSRRVDHREVFAGLQRRLRDHFDLAASCSWNVRSETVSTGAVNLAHRIDNRREMRRVCREHGHVAHLRHALGADEVDRAERSPGFAYRCCQPGKRAGSIFDAFPKTPSSKPMRDPLSEAFLSRAYEALGISPSEK